MSVAQDQYDLGYYQGHGFPQFAAPESARVDLPAAFLAGIRDGLAHLPSGTNFNEGLSTVVGPATTPPPAPVVSPPPQDPPGGGIWAQPLSVAQAQYSQGFYYGQNSPQFAAPDSARVDLPVPYIAGIRDGLNHRPFGTSFADGSIQNTAGYYEVLASNLLTGKMPYDLAVGVKREGGQGQGLILTILQGAITFSVLGADPNDWTQGYRLSGPNGPIALRVGQLISTGVLSGTHADPSFYGLDGWYGAKTRDGFKLLGRGELQALGLVI